MPVCLLPHLLHRGLFWGLVGGLVASTLSCAPPAVHAPASLIVPVGVTVQVPVAARLSVRPHAMATGTRTARAGDQTLDLGPGRTAQVYVPPSCVGTRRCPLVLLPDLYRGSATLADQYGMILLAVGGSSYADFFSDRRVSVDPGVPYLVREIPAGPAAQYIQDVDTALTLMLRTYAIDPAKIAVTGNSVDGALTYVLGCNNPDVFSRIAPRSPASAGIPLDGPIPRVATTQFFFSAGTAEPDFLFNALNNALAVRWDGYPVKFILEPKGHMGSREPDVPALFRWLVASWADPAITERTLQRQAQTASAGPLMTADALARWTAFWTRFKAEPDSIRSTASRAHVKEIPILVGHEPVTLLMADLPALAAQYPSVAADLKAAGLTAAQAEGDRVALLSAWTTITLRHQETERALQQRLSAFTPQERKAIQARVKTPAEMTAEVARWRAQAAQQVERASIAGVVAPTSVLGRNMAFLAARPALVQQLETITDATENMWWTIP